MAFKRVLKIAAELFNQTLGEGLWQDDRDRAYQILPTGKDTMVFIGIIDPAEGAYGTYRRSPSGTTMTLEDGDLGTFQSLSNVQSWESGISVIKKSTGGTEKDLKSLAKNGFLLKTAGRFYASNFFLYFEGISITLNPRVKMHTLSDGSVELILEDGGTLPLPSDLAEVLKRGNFEQDIPSIIEWVAGSDPNVIADITGQFTAMLRFLVNNNAVTLARVHH